MVEIKYVKSIDQEIVSEHDSVMSFLKEMNFSKSQLLNLRFFRGSVLSSEIDTSNTEFLDISDGSVTVLESEVVPNGPAIIIAAAAFAVSAVAAIIIANSVRRPNVSESRSVDPKSATNKLGKRQNDFRIGQRIDDIYGTVNYHVPSLLQEPHVIFSQNREIERFLTLVGRGHYRVNGTPRDGDTLITRLPDAKCNIYGPYKNPNAGDTPDYNFGGLIDSPIRVVKSSLEVQSQELLPPNEKGLLSQNFLFNGVFISPGVIDLEVKYVGQDPEFDFGNEFVIGDYAPIKRFIWLGEPANIGPQTVTLNRTKNSLAETLTVKTLTMTDFSFEFYKVKAIEPKKVTFDTSELPASLRVRLEDVVDYSTVINPDIYYSMWGYEVIDGTVNYLSNFITTNPAVKSEDWFLDGVPMTRLNILSMQSELSKEPQIGLLFNNDYGPIRGDKTLKNFWFNLVARGGFYNIKENQIVPLLCKINVYVEELDQNGLTTGRSETRTFDFRTNSREKTTQAGMTFYFEVPADYYDYQITFRRITNRVYEENLSNVDKVFIDNVFFYGEPIDMTPFGNVTIAQVEIPSSPVAIESKKRLFNLDVTRKLRHYQGNGVISNDYTMVTDQFDQIIINMCIDEKMGNLPLGSFDADNFLALRNQQISYYGDDRMCKFGFNFDDNNLSFQDCYVTVLNAVNCVPFTQLGVYSAIFEKSQPESSMQVTHRNKIPGTEKKTIKFDREYDGVSVTYRDNLTGEFSTLTHPVNAIKPDRIELNGVTTLVQAKRRLMREYYRLKYTYIYTEFEMDDFGQLIVPGLRIDSTDGTRFTYREGVDDGYRIYDGEVVNVSGLTIELSQPVSFTDGERHYIVFTKENGDNSEAIECTTTGSEFSVTLNSLPVEPIYYGYNRDRTKFIFFSEQLRDSIALIPKTINYKYDDGVETFSVSCVNYDERIYQDDTKEF